MDNLPARIADFLEMVATRIRAMTVDRVRNVSTWAAVGLTAAIIGLVLAIYLVIGLFRWLSELVGVEPAYLILGGLFLVLGWLLWWKRILSAGLLPQAAL